MAPWAFFLFIGLILQTILLIFGMKYFAATRQARSRVASDDAYRELAAKAVATQGESVAALAGLDTALADIRTRLAAIEKVLKEVE